MNKMFKQITNMAFLLLIVEINLLLYDYNNSIQMLFKNIILFLLIETNVLL